MNEPDVAALVDLGFTELESRVYLCLLEQSPLTGYAIAKAIGKPAANTYQAIESLARKSAVMVDEGESRLCRAIEPEQLLAALERDFGRRRERALDAVERLYREPEDQRVYQLRTPEQVFDRARRMIEGAATIVLADAFPGPLARLAPALEAAAARGVLVCVHAYRPAELAGVHLRQVPAQRYAVDQLPGSHLALVSDAEQHLYALMNRDLGGVRQAVWSESLYLSCMAHNHLAIEFEYAAVHPPGGSSLPIHLVRDQPPGFARLQALERSRGPSD